jgi:hypothetical protein
MAIRVIICRGDLQKASKWANKQTALKINSLQIREMLGLKIGRMDYLVLSIRDTMMVKCLRCKRNVILIGSYDTIEQLERIDMVLKGQGNIDGAEYPWRVRDF